MTEPSPSLLAEIANAAAKSDFERANALAAQAAERGERHPTLFNVQALWNERLGRDHEAALLYRRAAELAPRDVTILNALGLCLARIGQFRESTSVLRRAVELDPRRALSHYRLGWALWKMGDAANAEPALRQALSLQPNLAEALSLLAAIAAARGDMAAAGPLARQALQIFPGEPTAECVTAAAEHAGGEHSRAETRLRRLLGQGSVPSETRISALGLLGSVLRSQGKNGESFAAYSQRNALLRPQATNAAQQLAGELEVMTAHLSAAPQSFWLAPQTQRHEATDSRLLFIAALPRSGGEVLSELLARQPGIGQPDASDLLGRVAKEYLTTAEGLRRFSDLGSSELAALRQAYWSGAKPTAPTGGTTLVTDYSAQNAFRLPLLARLFPRARVVVVDREPRDRLASCIAELPRVLDTLAGETEPAGLAWALRKIAAVIDTSNDHASMPIMRVRYENLMLDARASVSAICDFAGVDFDRRTLEGMSPLKDDFGYSSEQPGMWRIWAGELAEELSVVSSANGD